MLPADCQPGQLHRPGIELFIDGEADELVLGEGTVELTAGQIVMVAHVDRPCLRTTVRTTQPATRGMAPEALMIPEVPRSPIPPATNRAAAIAARWLSDDDAPKTRPRKASGTCRWMRVTVA